MIDSSKFLSLGCADVSMNFGFFLSLIGVGQFYLLVLDRTFECSFGGGWYELKFSPELYGSETLRRMNKDQQDACKACKESYNIFNNKPI